MPPPNNAIAKFVSAQAARTSRNLDRARKLVALYLSKYGHRKGRHLAHETDLLRAAVVFTHAALEDFIRTLSSVFLPWASEQSLNRIRLAGIPGTAEKFSLGNLIQHRTKTVQELIQDSVDEYLESSNYNDTTQIAGVLAAVGLQHPKIPALYTHIQAMVERRHQIVHRADRMETNIKRPKARALSDGTVVLWIDATASFASLVLTHVSSTATRYPRKSVP